ncbi:trigger factor ['Fragaria x ananassa' phyllody phytoplasma]|uniref:Trigger factor n=1 Tax='Fragaria x ananassa' phyllody phytoplasma TaxID=2358428 RepID=A0ABS5K5Q6_9MOLU|nr:trigger factor ['Fragaria x ananassa' phyllody phytoplasma]MBS2126555.1 trigger factor ['Fragaria x ananassa' phyllody phytoplasma]
MKIKKVNDQKIQYFFKVSTPELEENLTLAYEKIKSKIKIKGFRKGYVPRNIFEIRFGKNDLYFQALEIIVQQKYQEALTKKKFENMGIPQMIALEEKKFKEKQDFTFGLEFMIKPKVVLGKYLGLTIKQSNLNINDNEIATKINSLIDRKSTLEPKSTDLLEKKDTAIFDFEGFVNNKPFEGGKGQNYSLEIGSSQFVPGFEEQMLGMKRGEKKDIEIIFPNTYHQKDLANQKAIFKITLHDIKIKKMPKLNDDLVKTLQYPKINTLEQLRNHIKQELLKERKKENDENLKKEVINQIVSQTKLEISTEIVTQEQNRLKSEFELQLKKQNLNLEQYQQYLGITKEKMEAEWYEQTRKNLEYQLIMEQIALEEKITISEEKLEKYYLVLNQNHKIPVEQIKKNVNPQTLKNSLLIEEAWKLVLQSVIFSD